jgi:hypothetical protein
MKENQQIENFALISDNSDNPNQTLENINSPAQAEQVPGIKIAKIISPTNDFKYDNDDDYLFLSMFNLFFCLFKLIFFNNLIILSLTERENHDYK